MRALIIDDSSAMRSIISCILGEIGYETSVARHGGEGMAQLHSGESYDLALVDWSMPEMNGLEFVQAIRADAELCDLPLMVVSSGTEIESVAEALEAGANELMTKPFTKDALLEKLGILGLLP